MSVRMTRTCLPHSYAKYSAVVRAMRGVMIRSIVGSFACTENRMRNLQKETSKLKFASRCPKCDCETCQVKEKSHSLHRPILLEITFEKLRSLHVHTHCCEHNGEVIILLVLQIHINGPMWYRFMIHYGITQLPTYCRFHQIKGEGQGALSQKK